MSIMDWITLIITRLPITYRILLIIMWLPWLAGLVNIAAYLVEKVVLCIAGLVKGIEELKKETLKVKLEWAQKLRGWENLRERRGKSLLS